MTLQQDFDKIKSCFTAMQKFTDPVECYGRVTNRGDVVFLAARLMKPRQDVKRLVSQINFVCFSE